MNRPNKLRAESAEPEPTAPTSRRLLIEAKRLRGLANVLPPQLDREGHWSCWTGEDTRFSIFVPIPRSAEWRVTLRCSTGSSEANWENIFLSVEGDMHLCAYDRKRQHHCVSGRIPRREGGSGAILTFHLQETCKLPSTVPEPKPEGRAGLCVSSVVLEQI